MTQIYAASATTPAATARLPVQNALDDPAQRWTGQQIADLLIYFGLTVNALGSINSNTDIDFSDGRVVTATIAGNLTFTFSNPPAAGGFEASLFITNGGAHTITWPVALSWSGGTAPTLRSSGLDLVRIYTNDGGTTWFGTLDLDEQTIAIGSVTGLGTGVGTFLATPSSANLAAAVTDETGSGALVFATSPTLVTPALGTPASGDLQNCTAATTTTKGVSELATGAETIAIADTARTVTPSGLGELIRSTTEKTADFDFVEALMGIEVLVNSGSARVGTIELNATEAITTNSCCVVTRVGAGSVTVDAVAGVTINGTDGGSFTISEQYQSVFLRKTGTNAWYATGARSAVA